MAEYIALKLQAERDCAVLQRASDIMEGRNEAKETGQLLLAACREILTESYRERAFGR
jgi:hypothetical protein